MAIIDNADLDGVPGIQGTLEQRNYAARRASALVTSKWCNPIEPVPAWVKDIAVDVAARYLTNPKRVSSVTYSKSLDDGSKSETERYESGTRGGLYLTEDELAKLCPQVRTGVRGVGSTRLAVPGYQP